MLPFFGQDFGGAISAAPAYLLLGLLLYDHRITKRAVVLLAVVLVAAGLAVGFVDLHRARRTAAPTSGASSRRSATKASRASPP